MKLIIVGSSSSGNGYALQSDSGEIMLIEAGVPIKEVKRAIGYKTSKVVGCIVSHIHTDHAKYSEEYIRAGITVMSNSDVASRIYGVEVLSEGSTYDFGPFSVTPFSIEHDVPNFGYLVHINGFGSIFFATDCYNLHKCIKGCSCYLMECNYEDALLNKAVSEGKTVPSQANRIRLSHMSLAHAADFLQQCAAEQSAKHIVLIHGSSRHLNPDVAVNTFQRVFGIPTYYAKAGLKIELI